MLYSSSRLSNTADRPDQVQSGAGASGVPVRASPLDRTDGWDMAIRSVEGEALRRSGLYPRREDAEAAASFAVDVVDVHYPLHFAGGSGSCSRRRRRRAWPMTLTMARANPRRTAGNGRYPIPPKPPDQALRRNRKLREPCGIC